MNIKNILIIGSSGFIGKNIVESFKNSYYQLFFLTRKINSFNDNDKCGLSDIKSIIDFLTINKIDTIIHLASGLIPSSDQKDFNNELTSLVLPTFELIDYCSKNEIKFIFFSSGGTIYGNTDVQLIPENHSKNPINYYGYSKLMIEDYIQYKSRTTTLKYLIIRPSNVYGRHQKLNKNQGFIAVAINKILNNESIELWGDGSVIRDYIEVQDLVNITKELLENNIENEVLNVGSGIGTSLNEVISVLSKLFNSTVKVEYKEKRNVDVDKMVLDTTLQNKFINYNKTNIYDGIRNYIQFLGIELGK